MGALLRLCLAKADRRGLAKTVSCDLLSIISNFVAYKDRRGPIRTGGGSQRQLGEGAGKGRLCLTKADSRKDRHLSLFRFRRGLALE